jgi:predicted RNA-binding Zn-ribbon protein involved in translation (DUF1610 family)
MRLRSVLARVLTGAAALVEGFTFACPECGSGATRWNAASPAASARLCDDCGTRWCA